MPAALSGEAATGHLTARPGRLTRHLLADRAGKVPPASPADALGMRRGGAASDIPYGPGRLGLAPVGEPRPTGAEPAA
ncbi:hypothetical protein [Streptomyces sp. cmx-18-6]|uniref:hypothetical protein n=1 Tax=Streptomyces sp. cmx-18-6 TaxID=2790930 RepID=UPI00397FE4BB